MKECLGLIAELLDAPDHEVAEREAVLTFSSIVGAISLARAVDDPELSKAILVRAATALKEPDSNEQRNSGTPF